MSALGEIRLDSDDLLDEVVAANVANVHLERMAANHVWLRLELRDGSAIVVNLHTKRAALRMFAEREPAAKVPRG